uniref:Alpha-galactosidase n=1 Tax=Aplanochytrium stocchinoi TaxID=215587 RepID=A0A7S3LNX9_9STRA|eukprot:CAMPEP_0204830742 /NCGR_PEP_ID=MMETSP1346-20131115/9191_1 /ASSEMBLY_ACC=CAM_ASM_000771 /TAXON_ID=215587 /ORGANISM="Aplanochytrium stocchinoi, Strain GSBS06" /LENGTH=453 /DNA_ID=CAMNT_0051961245 /DNA_START=82 /DNA_END=1443 /DNA_ORIENTATION=-
MVKFKVFVLCSLRFLEFILGDVLPDGRGETPLMGWRSWNLYHGNVNQKLMMSIMDAIVKRDKLVNGKPTSLCDVGYCDVGLDDNWQLCKNIGGKNSYHDAEGKPIVNLSRFPNLKSMNSHAHKLGLTSGWYGNNCLCKETGNRSTIYYDEDAKATTYYGFDSIKLDGCGAQKDTALWHDLLNKYNPKGILIENCHVTVYPAFPTKTWCPWNYYRTSGDIRPNYGSVISNLQSTIPFANKGLSRPGCWAYPDMLEVGIKLSYEESRSHFGAWCIVSSPLILSHDLNDKRITDSIWDIITNTEAIEVNQAWAGHPGTTFSRSDDTVILSNKIPPGNELYENRSIPNSFSDETYVTVPKSQYFYKPIKQNGKKTAVLLMNNFESEQTLSVAFANIPSVTCNKCLVRDIWAQEDIGVFKDIFSCENVVSHDSCFLMISSAPENDHLISNEHTVFIKA